MEPSSSGGLESGSPPSTSSPAEADDLFECCVCLDLIYKPVVRVCGHISCFWCTFLAMDCVKDSRCPICRNPYKYFPAICPLLHNLLRKSKPADYKRREEEVLNTERKRNRFSPQFIEDVPAEQTESPRKMASGEKPPQNFLFLTLSVPGVSSCSSAPQSSTVDTVRPPHSPVVAPIEAPPAQPSLPALRFPAYCELCAVSLGRDSLRCRVCQGVHPGESPQVCLHLDAFLEKRFPDEYASRRALVQARPPSSASQAEQPARLSRQEDSPPASMEQLLRIHWGIGCDSCGMYPIFGKRYKCTDCQEEMGFDFCEACYEARSNFPARFNQRHTPDHVFELIEFCMVKRRRVGPGFDGGPDRPDITDRFSERASGL